MERVEVARIGQLLRAPARSARTRHRRRSSAAVRPRRAGGRRFDLGHGEPARHRIDARHRRFLDRSADVFEALLRQRPHLLGGVETDAFDHVLDVFGEAGQHEAGVAAGRGAGDAAAFQHSHRPAALGDLARDGQSGEPGADDADIDVEVEIQPWPRRRGDPRRLVPVGRLLRHSVLILSSFPRETHARLAADSKSTLRAARTAPPPFCLTRPCADFSCSAMPRPKARSPARQI